MKFPSLLLFFLLCKTFNVSGQVNTYPYAQSFETPFQTGENIEFLPGWWGNEVSSDSRRIYKAGAANAYSGEGALGILPTSTFVAELKLPFDASSLESGTISFQARTGQNGSGSRPLRLSISFSIDGGETFSGTQQIGGDEAFPNKDTDYQDYQHSLPQKVLGQANAVLRLQVGRGKGGEGSAARLFLDDFTISRQEDTFRLLSARGIDEKSIQLAFNRPLKPALAEDERNYQLNGGLSILKAAIDATDHKKLLLTSSPMQPGSTYRVRLGNIQDQDGNSAEGQEASFTFSDRYELQPYDLLISEIHAAPNENTLLPNVEWIEIYNASGRSLELEGVRFADESKSSSLSPYVLAAGGYLVLAPAAEKAALESYGPLQGLSPWPSLNNSEDQLSLYSGEGTLLDRVAYHQSWYNSSEKARGGWSLERIDLSQPCAGAANWSASVAAAGGSPAAANSIEGNKPDLKGPELLQAFAADSQSIQLLFNEALDTTYFSNDWFQLNPFVAVEAVEVLRQEQLLLKLAAPLSPSTNYFLQLHNLRDCSGNLLEEEKEIALAFLQNAAPGDVVINEVMFDPLAGSEEWLELANTSGHYLNLQNWQLATYDKGIKASAVLGRDYLLLPPEGYLVFSRNTAAVQRAFPAAPMEKLLEVPGLPLLPNAGDSIALLNEQGEVVELFGYSKKLHSPFVQETKGVSLERISFLAPVNGAGNWTSAASTSGHGTPGALNSQHLSIDGFPAAALAISPDVILPGSNGRADHAAIRFSSKRQGLLGSLRVLDEQGREIIVLASKQLLGRDAFFSWNGADAAGRMVRTGYYLIVLQVYDAGGYQKEYRKTIVVGNGFE